MVADLAAKLREPALAQSSPLILLERGGQRTPFFFCSSRGRYDFAIPRARAQTGHAEAVLRTSVSSVFLKGIRCRPIFPI